MRISDWSSDVCSSDLGCGRAGVWGPALALAWQDRWCSWRLGLPCCGGRVNAAIGHRRGKSGEADIEPAPAPPSAPRRDQRIGPGDRRDRKSVVLGKRESVRVDLGGRRFIKKKKTTIAHAHTTNTITHSPTTPLLTHRMSRL